MVTIFSLARDPEALCFQNKRPPWPKALHSSGPDLASFPLGRHRPSTEAGGLSLHSDTEPDMGKPGLAQEHQNTVAFLDPGPKSRRFFVIRKQRLGENQGSVFQDFWQHHLDNSWSGSGI